MGIEPGAPVEQATLERVARRLLDATTLCAIATVTPDGTAHVNTAYFAWTPSFELVWLSDPAAQHSANIRSNPSAAAAVYDSDQSWGRPDRGLQLFGTAGELVAEQSRPYEERFPEYRSSRVASYRFYGLQPKRVKLFDETALGAGTFVTANVSDGSLRWERTDVYRSAS